MAKRKKKSWRESRLEAARLLNELARSVCDGMGCRKPICLTLDHAESYCIDTAGD
jgi:hypothetical protein